MSERGGGGTAARARTGRHVALLRGINLGGRRVKSPALRAVFEELGFDDVATFLASGNVIFDATASSGEGLGGRIEAGLKEALGYDVPTFLRSCPELSAAASPERLRGSPLAGEEGVTVQVVFLREPVPADLAAAAESLRSGDDDFVRAGRELYWLRRGKISESPAWSPLEKALRGRGTMRNLNTVRRLHERFCAS